MKHMDIEYNFVLDVIAHKEVVITYTTTHHMVADSFTKPIPHDVYNTHVRSLGLRNLC